MPTSADVDDRPSRGVADAYAGTTGDSTGHSLTGAWQFEDLGALGDVEFKSITGWRQQDTRNFGDLDGVDNTIAPGGAGALNDLAVFTMYQLYEYQGEFPASLLQYPRDAMAKLWSLIDQFGGGAYMLDANFAYEQFSQELQMVGSTERCSTHWATTTSRTTAATTATRSRPRRWPAPSGRGLRQRDRGQRGLYASSPGRRRSSTTGWRSRWATATPRKPRASPTATATTAPRAVAACSAAAR